MESPRANDALENAPTTDVVKQALAETRELLQLDLRIAKQELREDLLQVKKAAIAGALAFVFVLLALTALVVAVILAAGASVAAALVTAAILLVLGGAAGALAYALAPKSPLGRTRQRLKDDLNQLKEHAA
jgi:uncharacterized membrane protein YqjE